VVQAIPAFPGAEGFGSETLGGRGGRVIEVTNLDPDGPGSLREAVSAEGPRIIVFRVGGTIPIYGGLSIREPFVTIAGQTAPGDGICLRGGTLVVHTHDVVIRHIRVRVGDSPLGSNPENRDCIDISGDRDRVYHVVIDHCSFSWGLDENVATWYGPRDVTIQWCITSESLLDSLHPKGPHGMGMILGSRDNTVTIHHCLFAHNNDRNALIGDTGGNRGPSLYDFRNNVIYNHGPWSCTNVRGTTHINYVGNTVRPGPDGLPDSPRGVRLDAAQDQLFFGRDSAWIGRRAGDADPRLVLRPVPVLGRGRTPPPDHFVSRTPIPVPPVTPEPAANSYETVLLFAGATLPRRDVVDARVVEEVRTWTGRIIDTQDDVGGWPEYRSGQPPADGDHDGMPDDWERRHGLAADDPGDGPKDLDGDGYTNVEECLNETDPGTKTPDRPVPRFPPKAQEGNEHLAFGKARAVPEPTAFDRAAGQELLRRVRAAGKEVADHLGMRFVRLEPGEFMRGQIKVTLTKPFEIATHEVTQTQWTAVMGTRPWLNQEYAQDAPDNAATYVSWDDCQEFITRLNACGPREYRLPTEAEWEYACRAGSTSPSGFWFDEGETDRFAWCLENTVRAGAKYAHAVGQKAPNAWGLFDMAGNVHEWCQDWYEYWYWDPERAGREKVDPTGAQPGSYYRDYHILRGGSFYYRARQILTYPSSRHRPGYRGFDVGFRLVRLLP
jgi:formylglycine-generating enzyme required for sulfatase activity